MIDYREIGRPSAPPTFDRRDVLDAFQGGWLCMGGIWGASLNSPVMLGLSILGLTCIFIGRSLRRRRRSP